MTYITSTKGIILILLIVVIGVSALCCCVLITRYLWPNASKKNRVEFAIEEDDNSDGSTVVSSRTINAASRSYDISYHDAKSDLVSDITFTDPHVDMEAQNLLNPLRQQESEFLNQFCRTMRPGIVVILHTAKKGSKAIKIRLDGSDLLWQSNKPNPKKRFRLKIIDILRVEKGKTTQNFQSVSASKVDENLCFSLITPYSTIDLQASSSLERDAMAKALELLVEQASMINPNEV
jgi:hypothetical protein